MGIYEGAKCPVEPVGLWVPVRELCDAVRGVLRPEGHGADYAPSEARLKAAVEAVEVAVDRAEALRLEASRAGGLARAAVLSAARRREIARMGARARWGGK